MHDAVGALKVIATSEEGEDQILELLGTGALVGMLDGLPRLVAVRALGDCRLVFISRTTFLECLSDSPKLKDYLLNKFIERLRQAGERAAVANLLSLKARPRLARALLELAQYSGEPAAHKDEIFIRHKIRHRELAALAGVTRETATRTLREWTESNIIRRRSAYYCVDRAALEAQAAIGDCAKAEPASEDRSTKSGRFGSDQQPVSLLI